MIKRSFKMHINNYANIYGKQAEESYFPFNEGLFKKYGLVNDYCLTLAPIIDLIRPNPDISKKIIDLSAEGSHHDKGILFKLTRANYKEGDPLFYTLRDVNNEELYLNYGMLRQQTIFNLPYKFTKDELTGSKAEICDTFGCGGFKALKYINSDESSPNTHSFKVDNKDINIVLLNILRVLGLDDSKISKQTIKTKLSQYNRVDYDNETSAIQKYFSILKADGSSTVDLVKLHEDLFNALDIFKQIQSSQAKPKDNPEEVTYSLHNNISLLNVAYQKKMTLLQHEVHLHEESIDNLMEDLIKIKNDI
jgi:hypothetical protein